MSLRGKERGCLPDGYKGLQQPCWPCYSSTSWQQGCRPAWRNEHKRLFRMEVQLYKLENHHFWEVFTLSVRSSSCCCSVKDALKVLEKYYDKTISNLAYHLAIHSGFNWSFIPEYFGSQSVHETIKVLIQDLTRIAPMRTDEGPFIWC